MKKSVLLFAFFTMATILSTENSLAGAKVNVGQNVPARQQISMDEITPSQWDALLKKYVNEKGEVNYAAWKQSAEDMQTLDAFLSHLSSANPNAQASVPAKLAFWINAYNAVTVRGILREYPTTSIKNHTAKLFGYNIWNDLLLTVGGQPFSLNQMEHEVLRKMGEPRIHFAIVCASRGCPRLLNEAYTATRLEAQLTTNTKVFFANPNNFQYDPAQQLFRLSSILDWFGSDFGSDQAAQLRRISPYLPSQQAATAAAAGVGTVRYLDYDWGLNDQASSSNARR
ncbi:Uncharacterized protein DUF547 [Rhodopirellula islandica]|uniref:Uncharacterized protein DUF547 n=1 Tax=Rhodopirellula islandica TaxID=595434 RepID=A0A0J1BM00_RHOIS|nr:DUF547 domain-containing protein [Rhodopirellula islandica]KLU07507.1 Uncharacterized protein DUF547 [Rhodopirellula islandica]